MDMALDEICDKNCHECTNADGQLCRRWVPEFQARQGDLVAELRMQNAQYHQRIEESLHLVRDAMTYIITMKQKKLISREAFNRLSERARKLAVFTDEIERVMREENDE